MPSKNNFYVGCKSTKTYEVLAIPKSVNPSRELYPSYIYLIGPQITKKDAEFYIEQTLYNSPNGLMPLQVHRMRIDFEKLSNEEYLKKYHSVNINVKVILKQIWNKACEFDDIEKDSKFVVFSKDNPYDTLYNDLRIAMRNNNISEIKRLINKFKEVK